MPIDKLHEAKNSVLNRMKLDKIPLHLRVIPTLLRLDCDIDGNEETKIIAIDSDMQFIGTVGLQYKNLRSSNIRQLYVDSVFRGQGIGEILVKECCQIAHDYGCKTMGLVVDKANDKARIFYSKLGFSFAYQYDNGDDLMVIALTV